MLFCFSLEKRKSTQPGEVPPEPGSFPLRPKAGLRRSRADKTGSRPGSERWAWPPSPLFPRFSAVWPGSKSAEFWWLTAPPTPHHFATKALLTSHQTCNTSEKFKKKKISSSPARGMKQSKPSEGFPLPPTHLLLKWKKEQPRDLPVGPAPLCCSPTACTFHHVHLQSALVPYARLRPLPCPRVAAGFFHR